MKALTHTQQAYILSLNIVTQDDTGLRLAVLPLLSLTWLIMAIWLVRQSWSRFCFWLWPELVEGLAQDIQSRLQVTSTLLIIGLNSLAFGMGVSL